MSRLRRSSLLRDNARLIPVNAALVAFSLLYHFGPR